VTLPRGSVWFVELPEIGDKPAVVVSWEPIQDALDAAIVARITSVERQRSLPTAVRLEAGEGGLEKAGYVLCHNLFTSRHETFRRRAGELSPERMAEVDVALRRSLDLG
jgi:mRNA-degrading endonuclease toxin of MazEF toxin-antitoxin module